MKINNAVYTPKDGEIQDLQSAQVAACRDFYTERRFQHVASLADVHVSVVDVLPTNEEVTRVPWSSDAQTFVDRCSMFGAGGFRFRTVTVEGRLYFEF